MCAICGWITSNPSLSLRDKMKGMCRVMQHRGPDDRGVYVSRILGQEASQIGLGHNRLSIIDLSEQGRQPMGNEDGSVQIIFNGEVYNFQALRKELIAKGHIFRSKTDTETIVHLYEEEGEACVERLRGMFAFAIWDAKRQRLVLARDRLGIKPLYYSFKDGELMFASEIKALLAMPELDSSIDYQAIDHYLRYFYIPGERTIFKKVRKLKPGCMLVWEQGQISIKQYWDLDYEPKWKENGIATEEVLLEKLREAVKMRLVADVPVGAFLSGGIDSSVITALMREMHSGTVKTFSVGFEDCPDEFNELTYARLASKHLNTEHHEIVVSPRLFMDSAMQLQYQLDEPHGDFAAIPTYLVSKLARSEVKVVLTGEGADEMFAGYQFYQQYTSDFRVNQLLNTIRSPLLRHLVNRSAQAWPFKSNRLQESLCNIAYGNFKPIYPGISHIFNEEMRDALYADKEALGIRFELTEQLISQCFERRDVDKLIDKCLLADVKLYLAEDLLMKIDKATMLVSLEARVPFLDHHFVEWAAKLQSSHKVNGGMTKGLLRRAARHLLPKEILEREKHGFNTPLGLWMRGELRKDFESVLLNENAWIYSFLRKDVVEEMWEKHISGRCSATFPIWALCALELWYQATFGSMQPVAKDPEK